MKIIPVILSGGSGTRLWPLSRKQHPKQYLKLTSSHTMLQETLLRLEGLDDVLDPVVICNTEHRFLVAEQLKKINIPKSIIILEPAGRNTAPAIAAAAYHVIKIENAVMLVLSADHIILNERVFHEAIKNAINVAKKGKLVTFGVVPTDANTGYGYIRTDMTNKEEQAYSVDSFVEKPSQEKASQYLKEGNYLWNSGMFLFESGFFLKELQRYSESIAKAVNLSVQKAEYDLDFVRLNKACFESSPSDSIDYAVMEKSSNVMVVPLDAGWSDIGSWAALYDVSEKDEDGNVITGDVIAQETTNTYINANHHMVATIGVDDLIIIDTPDATLIASKDKAQEVKKVVEMLQKNNRHECGEHRKVYRPWGWYDSIEQGNNFQVKRLHVYSGAKLSLQLHHKRAEHWVVVKGVATVINGENNLSLSEGQSTYIPVGVKHSLANNSDEELEVIEVQSGAYLGEDDIVRFEDVYGRVVDVEE